MPLATSGLIACFARAIAKAWFVSRVWERIRCLVAEEGRLCMDIASSAWPEAGQNGVIR
jgi:hypothetical protein